MTPPSKPADPTSLQFSNLGYTSVNLAWTDNASDESGFRIERSTNGGTSWTTQGTVGANVTAYTATGLSSGTAYSMRVIAYNGAGDSGPSNAVSFTTPTPPPSTDMWVANIAPTATTSRNNWYGHFTVTIVDASGPVANATVSGIFGMDASGSGSAVTNSSGQCTISTAKLNRRDYNASFTVTSVTANNHSYNASKNIETTDSVAKP